MSILRIRKREGDFEHILTRDVATKVAVHLQLPLGENNRRVVVAMPAGKSALCFETAEPADWLLKGEVTPFAKGDGQRGIRFNLRADVKSVFIPTSSILLNHTLMARFGVDQESRHESRLRSLIESGKIRELESRQEMDLRDLSDRGKIMGFAYEDTCGYQRRALDGKHHYRLAFAAGEGCAIRLENDGLRLGRKDGAGIGPLCLTVCASTDFEPPTPLPLDELLNEQGLKLVAKDPAFAEAMRNFEFLSYREKFLAGSWNFLSYFGRDTLISLRLMWPVLSATAKRTGMQSVANEISDGGVVNVTDEWTDDRTTANALECFFRAYDEGRLNEARPILQSILDGRVPEHPFLDVLDQTYMYPSALAAWFRELDNGELGEWLGKEHAVLDRTESNRATLLRNWNYVLESAAPYIAAWEKLCEQHPRRTPDEILTLNPDAFREIGRALVPSIAGAANWRDTYHLPLHCCSEDINVNLLPMAIAAIREMAGRIGGPELTGLAGDHGLRTIAGYLEDSGRFETAQEAWHWGRMREHFLVRRSAEEIKRDFERYLAGLGQGDVFGDNRDRAEREREALLRGRADGVSAADFLKGKGIPGAVKDGIEFTALVLDPEGHPVPVMQSDDVFLLLFGRPTLEQFRKIAHPLVLPYPFGLGFWDDEIGFAISNPIYSIRDNPALHDNWKNMWVKFGPEEYHGRGAWPWVLFALIGGTHDQVMRSIDPAGKIADGVAAEDLSLFEMILTKSRASIAKLGPLATSEVYKYAPAADGAGVWQAEPLWISTPIQLWSASPARLLIDEALQRIGMATNGVKNGGGRVK